MLSDGHAKLQALRQVGGGNHCDLHEELFVVYYVGFHFIFHLNVQLCLPVYFFYL